MYLIIESKLKIEFKANKVKKKASVTHTAGTTTVKLLKKSFTLYMRTGTQELGVEF